MRRAVLAIAVLLTAAPSCLPTKPPRHRERLYTAPAVAAQRETVRVPSAPVAPTSALLVEEDEFTQQTRATVRDEMPPHGFTVSLLTQLPGAAEFGAMLVFSRGSADWRYLRCHHVDMLVDGQPLALTDEEHDGRVLRGGVSEHVSVRLDGAALQVLLAAREVRARICADAWTFTPRMMAGFVELRAHLDPSATIIGPAP